MKKRWIWVRSDRYGICVSSTRIKKEWGNDWDGTRELKRVDIFRNKLKKFNNLRGLIHGEKLPHHGHQSVAGFLRPVGDELPLVILAPKKII
jgi:hypothetical protein